MLKIDLVHFDDYDIAWKQPLAEAPFSILLFVNEGGLTYWVDGREVKLEKGDVLFIPKGSMRSGETNVDQLHQKYSVHFAMEMPFLPMLESGSLHIIQSQRHNYMKQRFSLLYQHWISKSPYHQTICQGILLEILGLVNEEMDMKHISTKKLTIVNDVKEFIIENYRDAIKIDDLAQLTGKTANYVTSTFRELTGSTPIEFLHQVRIFTACDLLLNTQMTMAEIADHLGFCDSSYFNRIFKKVMGYPPSHHLSRVSDVEL